MAKEIVIHANVRFAPTCLYCGSPFDDYEEEQYDYEGDPCHNAKGHYKCGTTLESLVSLPLDRSLRTGYGPDRTFQERLIERTWACEQLAVRK